MAVNIIKNGYYIFYICVNCVLLNTCSWNAYTNIQQWIIWKTTKCWCFKALASQLVHSQFDRNDLFLGNHQCIAHTNVALFVEPYNIIFEKGPFLFPLWETFLFLTRPVSHRRKPIVNFDYFLSFIDNQLVNCSFTLEFNEDSDWLTVIAILVCDQSNKCSIVIIYRRYLGEFGHVHGW